MSGLGPLRRALGEFTRSCRGNIAMISAICAVPLALGVGIAVDLQHRSSVQNAVQDGLDAALLAAAATGSEDESEVDRIIRDYFSTHLTNVDLSDDYELAVDLTDSRIAARVDGETDTYFAGLIGRPHLPVTVSAAAVSGSGQIIELALVVDNTWSMSADAGGAMTRIAALKAAAHTLVDSIMVEGGQVRISLVPYADYVNVGPSNRNASWINVPADYSVTSPRTCSMRTTRTTCTGGVWGTRDVLVDGVPTPQGYWEVAPTCTEQRVAPYEQCSGGTTTNYTWFGCVLSRNAGTLRLSDEHPEVRYTGFLGSSQACLNSILPLASDRAAIDRAIDGLVINIGSYRPETFIPAGLVWGVNVLSPSPPFTEGAPYGDNVRKIVVLMTDGSNTLQFRVADGRHVAAPSSAPADSDARAICDYARGQGIQVYTVGLAVPSGPARDLMRYCASSTSGAYDARDASELVEAFRGIARSINAVRLVQ